MGLWDNLFGRNKVLPPSEENPKREVAVGAKDDNMVTLTFNDKNITFTGDISGYNYSNLLRDKQRNITSFFEQADYFVDADPIFRGIIKEVYTPFSCAEEYRLVGADEKVKQKYLDYYDRIHLKDKMVSIFLQYYKYGNVYVYLMEDGTIVTLPVHMIRIANIMVNGEPVLEFNCRTIRDDLVQQGVRAEKDWIDDENLEIRLKGFPKEVGKALKDGKEYVQLDPSRTFVLQDVKEDWMRYSVPMIASCLKAFAKKELISNYENALLNLGMRSFVHAKYGDPSHDVLPDTAALRSVSNIFKQAMTGSALAVTNNWCNADIIQPDTKDMFEYDKYKGVNADILSAGGISGVIVSGRSEDGSTFASAQVSMQTAAMRIKTAKDNFCEMMNKINAKINGTLKALPHSAPEKIPRFTFPPVDLSGSKAFQETCFKLWKEGCVSSETMLQAYGFDMGQEVERKRNEMNNGVTELIHPAAATDTEMTNNNDSVIGRPTLDENERNSDPLKSETGRQPKPSNPEGSEKQT